jgi:CDP-paratose synthetase
MVRTVLLTGGTGFLGSHLLEAFLEQGYGVSLLKRSSSDVQHIKHLVDNIVVYDVDIEGIEKPFLDRPITDIVHVACSYGRQGQSFNDIMEVNVMFGLRLWDAAVKYNVKNFVNADTLLPSDVSHYALSKKQFTEWLYKGRHNLKVINLRLEQMYGLRDDVSKFIPWLISQLTDNVKSIPLTEGSQLRDFTHVDDVVSAFITAMKNAENLPNFSSFDVGTGTPVSVRDFVTEIYRVHKLMNKKCNSRLDFGSIPLRDGDIKEIKLDNSKLLELGWKPKYYSKEIGIKRLYEDLR